MQLAQEHTASKCRIQDFKLSWSDSRMPAFNCCFFCLLVPNHYEYMMPIALNETNYAIT